MVSLKAISWNTELTNRIRWVFQITKIIPLNHRLLSCHSRTTKNEILITGRRIPVSKRHRGFSTHGIPIAESLRGNLIHHNNHPPHHCRLPSSSPSNPQTHILKELNKKNKYLCSQLLQTPPPKKIITPSITRVRKLVGDVPPPVNFRFS